MRTITNQLKYTVALSLAAALMFACSAAFADPAFFGEEREDQKIVKRGLVGAGVGAVATAIGDGNVGTGALVGTGISILGGALWDNLAANHETKK